MTATEVSIWELMSAFDAAAVLYVIDIIILSILVYHLRPWNYLTSRSICACISTISTVNLPDNDFEDTHTDRKPPQRLARVSKFQYIRSENLCSKQDNLSKKKFDSSTGLTHAENYDLTISVHTISPTLDSLEQISINNQAESNCHHTADDMVEAKAAHTALAAVPNADLDSDNEFDGLCFVCMDRPFETVLIECGHR